MGGKSFAKPASRLTTAELNSLTSYCQTQLNHIFPRVERLRCITTKSSHGDLDLLCPFDRLDIRIGQSQVGLSSDDGEERADADGTIARLRAFCDDVSALLGANGWVIAYYGYLIIALQVPFKQVHKSTGSEEQAFWQVDIALTPMGSYDAYLFSCSYDIPFALLVLATQTLSSSFWLKRDALCIRHRPFFGQPFVETTLITNRDELYSWLGLDMVAWNAGFDDYESIYKWITTNPAGSALAEAWDKVAAGQMDGVKVEYKRLHTRVDGVPDFILWLKSHRLIPDTTTLARPQPRVESPITEPETVQEIPLDDITMRLLIKSGRLSAYEEQVKALRIQAERIIQAHENKKANRVRARLDEERGRAARVAQTIAEAAAKYPITNEAGEVVKGGDVDGRLASAVVEILERADKKSAVKQDMLGSGLEIQDMLDELSGSGYPQP